MFALSNGQAIFQCSISTETVEVYLMQILLSGTLFQSRKFLNKVGSGQCWPKSDFFRITMIFSVLAVYQSFDTWRPVAKLWFMTAIEIYYISRMPREKTSDSGKKASRQGWKYHGQPGKYQFQDAIWQAFLCFFLLTKKYFKHFGVLRQTYCFFCNFHLSVEPKITFIFGHFLGTKSQGVWEKKLIKTNS